ncbi:MAG: hypothetical protein GY898_33305 [Proteobacteria bacterium]|nr:hypothetical protein [Pseudomonadota bacterium]
MSRDSVEARIAQYGDVAGMARDSLSLLAVYEVGVFAALLDGPLTAAQLGAACSAAPLRLGPLLDLTAACGFLSKDGDRYGLVDGDAAIFDPAGPYASSLGFSDVDLSFGRMARMVEVLRTDTKLPAAGSGGEANAAERERFLRYLHSRSLDGAEEVADLLAEASPRSIVDLGCGLGT